MFMIPMPPTTSEIEAIPPSSSVSVPLIDEAASSSWVWLKTLKSAVSVGGQVVAVAQQRRDRGVGRGHLVRRRRRCTPIVRTVSPPTKYFWTTPSGTRTWSSGFWKPVPPLGWRMPMTWNGRPPMRDLRCRCRSRRARGRRGRRAEDGDAQALVDARRRSGTCPARRRRRGPSGRPASCRRSWSWSSSSRRRRSGWSRARARRRRSPAAWRSRRVVERRACRAVLPLAGRADRQQVRAEAGEPARDVRRSCPGRRRRGRPPRRRR